MSSTRTIRAQDHQEALAEAACDLAVLEMAYLEELLLGEVDADLLPGLAHRRVQPALVFFIAAPAGKRNMRRPLVVLTHGALDEQQLRRPTLDPRQREEVAQARLGAECAVCVLLCR